MNLLLVLLFVGVAVAAACQVVTGRGFRIVAAPVLILVCGHAEGLRLALLLGLVLSLVMFLGDRKSIKVREVVELAVPAVVTVPLWALLIGLLPHTIASRVAGAMILLAVGLSAIPWLREARWRTLWGSRKPKQPVTVGASERPGVGQETVGIDTTVSEAKRPLLDRVRSGIRQRGDSIATGVVSSLLFVGGGVGGAPLAMYGHVNRWTREQTRGVLCLSAALIQLVVLVFLGLPQVIGADMIVTLAAALVGTVGGICAARRWSVKVGHRVTWAVAAGLALVLLVMGTQL